MRDDIRAMSDELAANPSSLVFAPLGEALRRGGKHDLALQVALRGLERHPHGTAGHDLLARISADRGDIERAFDEWDMVLRLDPAHLGALKGMGFICFHRERFASSTVSVVPYCCECGSSNESGRSSKTTSFAHLPSSGGCVCALWISSAIASIISMKLSR